MCSWWKGEGTDRQDGCDPWRFAPRYQDSPLWDSSPLTQGALSVSEVITKESCPITALQDVCHTLTTSVRGFGGRYATAEIFVSCPCLYTIVEKRSTQKKPSSGWGRLLVFYLLFHVGQHVRTGSSWLFLSDADTQ